MKMHLQQMIKQSHVFGIALERLATIYDLHLINETALMSLIVGTQRLIILGGAI